MSARYFSAMRPIHDKGEGGARHVRQVLVAETAGYGDLRAAWPHPRAPEAAPPCRARGCTAEPTTVSAASSSAHPSRSLWIPYSPPSGTRRLRRSWRRPPIRGRVRERSWSRRQIREPWLLSQRVTSPCGKLMWGSVNSTGRRQYRCATKGVGRVTEHQDGCGCHQVHAGDLEDLV
jgi:hypothetical protein